MSEKEIILKALNGYYYGFDKTDSVDISDVDSLFKISRQHKILPIVFSQLCNSVSELIDKNNYDSLKKETLGQTAIQVKNDSGLIQVCKLFDENSIPYAVCKGAACRAMYRNPELRISCDEDILINGEYIESAKDILVNFGFEILKKGNSEIDFVKDTLRIELQSRFDADRECVDINNMIFEGIGGDKFRYDYAEIPTLYPDSGFVMMSVHFYKHFVRGGIGIRQTMDLIKYADINKEKIDFDRCFDVIDKISGKKLIKTVLTIGNLYFDTDFKVAVDKKLADEFLDDIFNSGAYGRANSVREHSGTYTKRFAANNGRRLSSLIKTVFPDKKMILKKNPELNTLGKRIKFRTGRFASFYKEEKKLEFIKFGFRRERLLKKLGIN